MADLSREEFLAHIAPMRDDIREIIAMQRSANGRLGTLEGDMPEDLRERLKAVEERNPPGRVATSGISAIVSGVITGLGMWLSNQK
jgi:hypothetical protein